MGPQLYQRVPQAFVEEVLEAFNDRRMTEQQACALLGLKRGRLYRLRREWLRHRGTWKLQAPHRTARNWGAPLTAWLHEECRYLQAQVAHQRGRVNFAVLSEGAHQRFDVLPSPSGIRRWAIRAGYYQQTRAEIGKTYVRWESPGPGVLWHHDTSHHCWLPRRGGYQDLILTQDDYSRRIVGWRLQAQEELWDHLCVVRETIERWGRPLAYYVDEHGYFRYVARTSAWRHERRQTDEGDVQFRRILHALDVGIIYAHSPEAKGKIEKRFDYLQRRLPAMCERYGIMEVEHARPMLDDIIGYYNDRQVHLETREIPAVRWESGCTHGQGRLRTVPSGHDLPLLFAFHHERVVHSDGHVRFQGRPWAVTAPTGSRVTVCWRPAERLVMLWNNQPVGNYAL